jgi:tetracycline repressor-like protein
VIQAEALRLFTEKGFEATTIEEICRSGGCRPRTFFRYSPARHSASRTAASRSRSAVTTATANLGRVAPARYRAGAPSEPCVPAFQAHGSSKPRRLAGRLSSWPLRCTAGGLPTRAVGVHEAECGGVRPGPVVGQGAVVRRRAAGDHLVPDDSRSGELDQVSAAVAVIEHPAVPSGRVEHAEVPGDDPAPRLVRMGPVGPPCR